MLEGSSQSIEKVPSSFLVTRGTGRKGRSASETATGPAPGPPPPWGVEKVLCKLMCIASAPISPGRARPTKALRLAPSR